MSPILLIASFLLAVIVWNHRRHSRLPLPPGPRGSLFTGVKSELPKSEPWKTYAAWGARYGGPILSFRVFNRLTLVLNTHTAVHDLLERRAANYSGRPISWMYQVICRRANSVFNISASHPRHKMYRRLLQRGLSADPSKQYWPILEDEMDVLVHGFRETPERFEHHMRRNAAGAIMKVAFGYEVTGDEDPFISVAEQSAKISGWAMAPGRWLVDYWPILRFVPAWFPFANFQRQGAKWAATLDSLSEVPHQWVKAQMEFGTHVPSFTSRFLRPGMTEDGEDIVKWCAGALYAGAADTTVSALISFMMLMALHHCVQERAQRDIDANIDGPPRVADVYRAPYLIAVLKELMRYAPVANLALPHQATEEDTYAGYRIPAGATVIPNVWAVLHDSELYPDPFTFDPDRFVAAPPSSSRPSAQPGQPDPTAYVWGFGRRRCPGMHFAEPALLLSMHSILYNFTIAPAAHVEKVKFTTGITSHIKLFPIHITPRHRGV
ncbi:cytochrome P450 [Mycena crocata]|nr:cytochrome P450 [Mycena crocata]